MFLSNSLFSCSESEAYYLCSVEDLQSHDGLFYESMCSFILIDCILHFLLKKFSEHFKVAIEKAEADNGMTVVALSSDNGSAIANGAEMYKVKFQMFTKINARLLKWQNLLTHIGVAELSPLDYFVQRSCTYLAGQWLCTVSVEIRV